MSPRAAAILVLLQANPPMTSAAIGAAVGCKPGTAAEWLRVLRDAGLAKTTSGGRGAVWSTPEKVAAYAAREFARLQPRRDRHAALKIRRQGLLAEKQDEDKFCEAWLIQVRRVVPASQCAPLGRVGVCSVFELAEMA